MKFFRIGLICVSVLFVTISAIAATRHVSPRSILDGPGTEWYNAFHKIQDAVNVTSSGDTVLVAFGVYDVGTTVTPGAILENRVCITNDILLKSVNGPSDTFIVGAKASGGGNGSNAVRCLYMSAGVVSGFTLTNGATLTNTNLNGYLNRSGGGVYGYQSTILTNCILVNNSAEYGGGGSYRCTLNNCMVIDNSCGLFGGGSYYGTLNNCILIYNSTVFYGGGSYSCTLNNCTLTDNSASYYGGTGFCTLKNCIVYFNNANSSMENNNYSPSCTFEYSCTTPDPEGIGNITNDPQFVYRAMTNLHLSVVSPCIDRGDNYEVIGTNDFDGLPRIRNGLVDMGAYEYQWPDSDGDYMPDRWEWLHCGSKTNLISDADDDNDGHSNYQEYITGMNATNADSCFRIETFQNFPSADEVVISWESVAGRIYQVNWSTNIMDGVQPLASDILYPHNSYTDTIHHVEGIGLYQLDVQLE